MFAALALVAALVGGVVAAAGLVLQLRRRRIRRQWQPTSGRTSGTRHSERGSGSSVSFTTDDGRDIEGAPLAYVDIGYYPVGKEVPVWYDPADPGGSTPTSRPWTDTSARSSWWSGSSWSSSSVGCGGSPSSSERSPPERNAHSVALPWT